MDPVENFKKVFEKFFLDLASINLKLKLEKELSEKDRKLLESLVFLVPIIYRFSDNPDIRIEDLLDEKEKELIYKSYANDPNVSSIPTSKDAGANPKDAPKDNPKLILKADGTTTSNHGAGVYPSVNSYSSVNNYSSVNTYPKTTVYPSNENRTTSFTSAYSRYESDCDTDDATSDEEGDELVDSFTKSSLETLDKIYGERWIGYIENESDDSTSEYSSEDESSDEISDNELSEKESDTGAFLTENNTINHNEGGNINRNSNNLMVTYGHNTSQNLIT